MAEDAKKTPDSQVSLGPPVAFLAGWFLLSCGVAHRWGLEWGLWLMAGILILVAVKTFPRPGGGE